MIRNEFRRVLNKKFILFTVLLLLVNGLLIMSTSPIRGVKPELIKRAFQIIHSKNYDAKELIEHHDKLMNNETNTFLFSTNFIEEISLSRFISDYAESISNYDNYIDSIIGKDTEVSIFSKSSNYSKESHSMSVEKYSKLKDIKLKPLSYLSVEEPISFVITDIFVILIIFYVINILLLEDRNNGSLDFYRTMVNGRKRYAVIKLITISIIAIATVLVFQALNLIISTNKYGLIDYSAPIQSIKMMYSSFLHVNILEYLLIHMVVKCMVFCAIAFIMTLISFFVRSIRDFFVASFAFIALSWFLYGFISTLSPINYLRLINIIPMMRTVPLFSQLHTLNIFNNAFYYHHLVMIITGIVIVAAVVAVIQILSRAEIVGFRQSRLYDKFSVTRYLNAKTTAGFEVLKIGVYNRAFILGIVFIIWLIFRTYMLLNTNLNIQEQYYRYYVHSTSGKTDAEIKQMIREEWERFENLRKEQSNMWKEIEDKGGESPSDTIALREISKSLEPRSGFDRMVWDYYRIDALNNAYKQNLSLEYGGGVNRLTANDYFTVRDDNITAIGILVFMIGAFSSIFVSEKVSGMIEILKVTPKGKNEVVRYKLITAIAITSIAFIASQIPQFLQASRVYTMPPLSTPIYSFAALRNQPMNVSLLVYLILLYLSKYLGVIVCLFIIIIISLNAENEVNAIIASFSVLILPLFIDLYGNHLVRYFTTVGVASPNILLNRHGLYSFVLILEFLIIAFMVQKYAAVDFFEK